MDEFSDTQLLDYLLENGFSIIKTREKMIEQIKRQKMHAREYQSDILSEDTRFTKMMIKTTICNLCQTILREIRTFPSGKELPKPRLILEDHCRLAEYFHPGVMKRGNEQYGRERYLWSCCRKNQYRLVGCQPNPYLLKLPAIITNKIISYFFVHLIDESSRNSQTNSQPST